MIKNFAMMELLYETLFWTTKYQIEWEALFILHCVWDMDRFVDTFVVSE